MYFNSVHFALFFALVVPTVILLRRRVQLRNGLLFLASYYFYACWNWRFLSLIIVSTAVDYVCGNLLDPVHLQHTRFGRSRVVVWLSERRTALLATSVVVNLGILFFFKYFDFFVSSAAAGLRSLGLSPSIPSLSIVLPVGISFYTFQTLSYTIDIYRRRSGAEKNLLTFAVFVAYFPQLVAGPIERAHNLLPQLREKGNFLPSCIYSGMRLIGWGLFKKVVLADNVALVVDKVFGAETTPSALAVLLGVYAFAVQIYCDFSGYTDIARGTSRCMGIKLIRNFNLPYFAFNPSDFWRRWHISLSSWLRDYLYISLGGNRCSVGRNYANLMATMLLGGLWHGAGWTYIWWGFYHGVLLCGHRALKPLLDRIALPDEGSLTARVWTALRIIAFFHLVCISWLIFRAESMRQVIDFLAAPIRTEAQLANEIGEWGLLIVCLSVAFLFCVQLAQYFGRRPLSEWIPVPARAVAYAVMAAVFVVYGNYDGNAFIYFQF